VHKVPTISYMTPCTYDALPTDSAQDTPGESHKSRLLLPPIPDSSKPYTFLVSQTLHQDTPREALGPTSRLRTGHGRFNPNLWWPQLSVRRHPISQSSITAPCWPHRAASPLMIWFNAFVILHFRPNRTPPVSSVYAKKEPQPHQ